MQESVLEGFALGRPRGAGILLPLALYLGFAYRLVLSIRILTPTQTQQLNVKKENQGEVMFHVFGRE